MEAKEKSGLWLQLLGYTLIVLGIGLIFAPFLQKIFPQKNNSPAAENIEVEFTPEERKGDILEGAFVERASAQSLTAEQKSAINIGRMATEGRWIATNYEEGDILTKQYTIKRGDTLWEIAEAAYGSGHEWHKLLTANKSQIGFLPDGSQALIFPGQVINIPKV